MAISSEGRKLLEDYTKDMTDQELDEFFEFLMKIAERRVREESRMEARRRVGSLRPGTAVHHIDGNPYNNDPSNLRIVDIRKPCQGRR